MQNDIITIWLWCIVMIAHQILWNRHHFRQHAVALHLTESKAICPNAVKWNQVLLTFILPVRFFPRALWPPRTRTSDRFNFRRKIDATRVSEGIEGSCFFFFWGGVTGSKVMNPTRPLHLDPKKQKEISRESTHTPGNIAKGELKWLLCTNYHQHHFFRARMKVCRNST